MSAVVRAILDQHGRLSLPVSRLRDDDNLHDAGLDSMAMVNVMLAIEQAVDVEFPEHLLTRRSFSSIAALEAVLRSLTLASAALPAGGR